MIKFDKPENLNGQELLNELNSAGIVITNSPVLDDDGKLYLDIDEAYTSKATAIVTAHNGTTIAPDTSGDKAALLSRLGITADEAKLLLS
jgi:hypothetical protein